MFLRREFTVEGMSALILHRTEPEHAPVLSALADLDRPVARNVSPAIEG